MFTTVKSWLAARDASRRRDDLLFTLILIGSTVGLLASFVLSVEAIELAKNPNAVLTCSINAVVDCAAVGSHPSASVFGFPSSFLGLLSFPVMMTIAVAGLMGVRFPRLFMFGAQLGAILGIIFAGWMLYMSYAVIQVFCPWCLTVDAAMLLIFFALTRYNIVHENLYVGKKLSARLKRFVQKDFDLLLLVAVFVIVLFAILIKYRDTLLG